MDIHNLFQILNQNKVRYILMTVFAIFIANYADGQVSYTLASNNLGLYCSMLPLGSDSLQIRIKLINNDHNPIWISDAPYLFDPKIIDENVYLNLGLDANRNSLINVVPFPLRKIRGEDSVIVCKNIAKASYKNVTIICNYVSNQDYLKILKTKKTSQAIGLNDYYRYMNMLSFDSYVKDN